MQESLIQLRSLAIGAANEGYNDEAASSAYATAADNLVTSYNQAAESAQFGTQKLLDGNEGAVADVDKLDGIDLSSPEAAEASIEKGMETHLVASADGVYNFLKGQKGSGLPHAFDGFSSLIDKGLKVDL